MARPLDLVDSLVAEGKEEFTFDEARAALDRSPTATVNTLRRLQDNGLVDRLGRGRYAVRPLGSLHTSATTDDLALAVGATFGDREHRIAYLSALADLGLLSHPVRTITVACTTQVRVPAISRRPLRAVIERAETIHLEAASRPGARGARRWIVPCSSVPFGPTLPVGPSGWWRPSPTVLPAPTRLGSHCSPRSSAPEVPPPSAASPRSPTYSTSRSASPRASGRASR